MLNVQICQRQKGQHFSCSHSQTSSVLSTAQIFVRKSCWKVQCCSSCSSFHIPSLSLSLAHALWQWRKKRKKKDAGCSEKLNHGKDMCCCLIQPRTEEEDHWGRRSFSHSTFWSFPACSQWRWVRFITIMDRLMHVFWWPDFYFYYFSDNIVFWIFFSLPLLRTEAELSQWEQWSFHFFSTLLLLSLILYNSGAVLSSRNPGIGFSILVI